jgi:hypothetical protein
MDGWLFIIPSTVNIQRSQATPPDASKYDLALIRYGTVVLYSCTQYSVVGTVHRNSYLSAVPVLLSLYHHTSR